MTRCTYGFGDAGPNKKTGGRAGGVRDKDAKIFIGVTRMDTIINIRRTAPVI